MTHAEDILKSCRRTI